MVDLFSNEDLDAILNSDDNVWQDLGFELLNDDDPHLSTQTEPISSIQKVTSSFLWGYLNTLFSIKQLKNDESLAVLRAMLHTRSVYLLFFGQLPVEFWVQLWHQNRGSHCRCMEWITHLLWSRTKRQSSSGPNGVSANPNPTRC